MATTYQIIYWRDIPAQVKVRAGRQRVSRPLAARFEQAIDQAAMKADKTDSDDYLAEWRQSEWAEREGEPESLAKTLVSEIEADYSPERLKLLVKNGGHEA